MSYPKAIVIGAVLIAGAIALSTRVQASPVPEGKYQILNGSRGLGSEASDVIIDRPVVWRVNTETGQMVYCWGSGYKESSKPLTHHLYCVGSRGRLSVGSY